MRVLAFVVTLLFQINLSFGQTIIDVILKVGDQNGESYHVPDRDISEISFLSDDNDIKFEVFISPLFEDSKDYNKGTKLTLIIKNLKSEKISYNGDALIVYKSFNDQPYKDIFPVSIREKDLQKIDSTLYRSTRPIYLTSPENFTVTVLTREIQYELQSKFKNQILTIDELDKKLKTLSYEEMIGLYNLLDYTQKFAKENSLMKQEAQKLNLKIERNTEILEKSSKVQKLTGEIKLLNNNLFQIASASSINSDTLKIVSGLIRIKNDELEEEKTNYNKELEKLNTMRFTYNKYLEVSNKLNEYYSKILVVLISKAK